MSSCSSKRRLGLSVCLCHGDQLAGAPIRPPDLAMAAPPGLHRLGRGSPARDRHRIRHPQPGLLGPRRHGGDLGRSYVRRLESRRGMARPALGLCRGGGGHCGHRRADQRLALHGTSPAGLGPPGGNAARPFGAPALLTWSDHPAVIFDDKVCVMCVGQALSPKEGGSSERHRGPPGRRP